MRRKIKKRPLKQIYMIWLLIPMVVLVILILQIEKSLKPVTRLRGEHFAKQTATELVTKSVSDYLDENRFTYEDFATILYDDEKKPVSVEALPYTINKVQSELTYTINKKLEEAEKRTSYIPLGSLTDSPLFVGKGPLIKIRVCPDGIADVMLKNEFTEAGINQTCHRISAIVTVKMTSSVPMYRFDTVTEFEFVLAECIIVGNVPDITPYIKAPKYSTN